MTILGGYADAGSIRSHAGFTQCLADATARILKIHRVLLDADETFAALQRGHAGGAAAHERVEDRVGTDVVAEVANLRQRSRASR